MRKITLSASLLFICAVLIACRIDATAILRSEESLTLHVHSVESVITTDIPKGSQLYNEFRDWLIKNEEGWTTSPASYVPAIEIKGKKFSINFLGTSAILNFQDSNGSYHQYVKDAKPEEYQFLKKK